MTCDRPDSLRSSRRSFLYASAALVVAGVDLSAQAPPASTPAGFVPLFDGTLEGWVV